MVELLGGQMVRRIQRLKVDLLPIGKLARAYMLFLQPEPRAAWRWNRRRWRQDQAQTLLEHRERVVQALEDLDQAIWEAEQKRTGSQVAGSEEGIPLRVGLAALQGARPGAEKEPQPSAPGAQSADVRMLKLPHGGAGDARVGPATRARVQTPRGYMQTTVASAVAADEPERPVSKPMPGTEAYLALVRQARACLLSVRQTPTIEAVASYLGERPEDVRRAFALLEEQNLAARRARSPRHRRQGVGKAPAISAGTHVAARQMAAGA